MSRILLVEGPDDEAFITAVLGKEKQSPEKLRFEIKQCNGNGGILPAVRTFIKSGYSRLGIIIDADSEIQKRIDFLAMILTESKYDVKNPLPKLVYTHPERDQKFSCWIMPDNAGRGALETFYLDLIPKDDNLLNHAKQKLDELEKEKLNRYGDKREKALLHTWLAWQKEPGTRSGQAITKKYYTANSESMTEFSKWIQELFL